MPASLDFNHLPTFLVIGAAKAGTTTLYDILKQHPEIYMPFAKEPMFFSHDENFQRGAGWYTQTFFSKADGYVARGEASPHYLYWAEKVAPRIRALYGDRAPKFVVIFRDPVQRAYSWFWNMKKEGSEDLDFPQALAAEPMRLQTEWADLYYAGAMKYGYFRGGCYATQLEEFLRVFPRDQFYFLLQDDLRDLSGPQFRSLLRFLNVDPDFGFLPIVSNAAAMPRSRALHHLLHTRFQLKDMIKQVIPLRWRYQLRMKMTEANMRKFAYPALDRELAASLCRRYQPEIDRLEKLIQRDLSPWRAGW